MKTLRQHRFTFIFLSSLRPAGVIVRFLIAGCRTFTADAAGVAGARNLCAP